METHTMTDPEEMDLCERARDLCLRSTDCARVGSLRCAWSTESVIDVMGVIDRTCPCGRLQCACLLLATELVPL